MGIWMPAAARSVLLLCLVLSPAGASAQELLKTTLCEIARHPDAFNGKRVQIRGMVESGVEDLPAGISDETCGAEVKFLTPDDPQFARLLKSREFRKLTRDVKRHPVVEATVSGRFQLAGTVPKPTYGLALDSVKDIAVKPHAAPQKR